MWVIYFFSENVYLGMYILLWMDTHLYLASSDVFNELVHSIFYLFIILCLLDITFYLTKKLLL